MNVHEEEEHQQLISPLERAEINKQPQLEIVDPTTQEKGDQDYKQITHNVVYGDTLEGLSLEYSVPINKIKQRNHIEGDNFYHLKIIIIPNPMSIPEEKERTQELLIEEFAAHMDYKEKSKKVAKYYLAEASWDMEAARKQYLSDLQWERANNVKISSVPLSAAEIQMKQIRNFYSKHELFSKKTE